MHRRSIYRVAAALAATVVSPAPRARAQTAPLATTPPATTTAAMAPTVAPPAAPLAPPAVPSAAVPSGAPDPRFAALPELTVRAINTREQIRVRVYRADGTLDPDALARLAHLMRDLATGADSPLVPRTIQLLVRIATHFNAAELEVVSAYRSGLRPDGRRAHREGYHGVGSAVDFRMPHVESVRIAAYARTFAHVGVGYYPREGFVHLDSREQSFFWENGARRGRHGWNRPLDRSTVAAHESSWTPADDAPWDPPGAPAVALVLHPRTQPGAHRPHRHRSAERGHRHHARARPPLRIFQGGGATTPAAP